MIDVRDLSFRFQGSSTPALQGVNLVIQPGEFLVITGPSGCGKSTLALALGGYLFRQYDGQAEGAVRVKGMDARQEPIYDLAEVVGLVQQNPEAQFCTLTVQDEVAFGLENRRLPRDEIQARIDWALDVVGAGHLAGRSLATLSGGEKQKVAIAAMMATRPQVIIFDEPTSNLDPTATAEIFEVIAAIRRQAGLAVVVIEHKLDDLLPFAPRLVAMEAGRIVYDGPALGAPRPALHLPAPNGSASPAGEPLVRTYNLHAGYEGSFMLRGVSLEVHPGEFIAVMGDNGSGKTTFLLSLLGLIKPSNGYVQVLGRDTRHTPVSRLARDVGLVFQNPDHQLFADSVWLEATFAPHNLDALDEGIEARLQHLLERCGLGGRLDDHPHRLSYGQKRRLNLVSVLGYGPRLILLDELLIGQDPANAVFLLDLLRERARAGDAVILVNHAPEIARHYAGRVIFFQDGKAIVDAPAPAAFERLRATGRNAYAPRA